MITVPEDKVNGFDLPILLFCRQEKFNSSVTVFTQLVGKSGYMNCDNCAI